MPMPRAIRLAVPLLIVTVTGSHAQAQGALADRYGYAPAAYAAAAEVGPGPMRGRMLAWPGKQAASPVAASAQVYSDRVPAPSTSYLRGARPPAWESSAADRPAPSRPWGRTADPPMASARPVRRYGEVSYAARTTARPVADMSPSAAADGWRPVFTASAGGHAPVLAGAPGAASAPASIYSPSPLPAEAEPVMSPAARAAALGPPVRGSAAQRYGYDPTQDHTVRFYSVHRAFGLQPDPAPIPPQFFTATADLANPPGPLTTERTTTTSGSGSTTHAVRATPDAGTD